MCLGSFSLVARHLIFSLSLSLSLNHPGTITSLSFPSRTYLLSTGADGRICLYRTRDWALLRTLKGHVGRVNCAAAHPSGRLALSVGRDGTIRMWDLMRGRGAASTKIRTEGEIVRWNAAGTKFAVLAGTQLMVFATDMTRLHALDGRTRLHDVKFAKMPTGEGAEERELMLVCAEDKVVRVYDLDASANAVPVPREKKVPAKEAEAEAEDEDEEEDEEEDDELPLIEVARLVGHGNR